jgi:hypothetical protein
MHVLLAGRVVGQPDQGGATWAVLQWVLGLRALGHRVTVVEQLPAPPTPEQTTYARTVERQTGVRTLLLAGASADLARQIGPVDLLVNLSGVLRDPALLAAAAAGSTSTSTRASPRSGTPRARRRARRPHPHATVGLRLGAPDCPVPTAGSTGFPCCRPSVLDRWQPGAPVREPAATSVGHWRSYGPVTHDGLHYGQRAHSARRLLSLPSRSPLPLRLALGISPDETADLVALREHGWQLEDPYRVAGSPSDYRSFVRGSTAELGIAKSGYVDARTGWFSDRSACYLAAGRPVVAQETGWSAVLPSGAGLHAYADVDGAAAALEAVLADPVGQAQAAHAVARDHLDARKVVGRLLEAVG